MRGDGWEAVMEGGSLVESVRGLEGDVWKKSTGRVGAGVESWRIFGLSVMRGMHRLAIHRKVYYHINW